MTEIREYRSKLVQFYHDQGRMPGYNEMMRMFGFRSKNAVFKLLNKLAEAGEIEKDARGRITPGRSFGTISVLGVVEAGFPAAAEEQELDTVNLDELLVENKDRSFLLQVKGDSMIEAHIADGDLVVAERNEHPKNGDIVIAEADGEWTMKYFRKASNRAWLEPANRNYRPIHPQESLHVAAVVKAVIRKI